MKEQKNIYDMYHHIEQKNPTPHKPKLNSGEAETVRQVLATIQQQERKRIKEGFNEINFSVGVLNCMLVAYVFGNYPEHFWILYLVEALYLIPLKIWQDWTSKPSCRIPYYLDYCWIMNFLGIASLVVLISGRPELSDSNRNNLYMAVLGVTSGPLLGATAILPFVSLVFHDIKAMTSFFIHIMPPLLMYTFRWHSPEIKRAWPTYFHLDTVETAQFYPDKGVLFWPWEGYGSVAGNAMLVYFLWSICYSIWMIISGLKLSKTGRDDRGKLVPAKYETTFHSLVRNGFIETTGTLLWRRSREESRRQMLEGDYELRDFAVYMLIHALLCTFATLVVAYACTMDKSIHAGVLWCLVVICVFRGAQRYVYWLTSMSSKALQKEYREIFDEIKNK